MSESQSINLSSAPTNEPPLEESAVSSVSGVDKQSQIEKTSRTDTKDPEPISQEDRIDNELNLECPICGEVMVTLLQLNQHIDDSHSQNEDPKKDQTKSFSEILKIGELIGGNISGSQTSIIGSRTPNPSSRASPKPATPTKRSIKLDLYDDSGFGISEMVNFEEKLTRTHWRKSYAGQSNSCHDCGKPLNVKNGIVNCRKCGELFCNEHTKYVAKLANGSNMQDPVVYDSKKGKFSQVCRNCFLNKPLLAQGPQANSKDLTEQFASHRADAVEQIQISRQVIIHRYIKLVDILTQALSEGRLSGVFSYMDSQLAAQEKEIVQWEVDSDVTHCRICFEKFSIFSRKHHCRLCGTIVNERKGGPAYTPVHVPVFCSVQVPVPLLLAKLPDLNYSPNVRQVWERCMQEQGTGYSFRCCKTCKNLLLGNNRHESTARDSDDVVAEFNSFLRKKASILVIIDRYKGLVQENSDKNNARINKLRGKLSEGSRDLETWLRAFTARYFREEGGKLVARDVIGNGSHDQARVTSHDYARERKLISNVHASALMFLQDTLLEVKRWNDEFRASEKQRLAEQRHYVQDTSQLTKRQIRELREQLMVLNEQQFIVQKSMEESKKARRFDELVVLEENEGELKHTIAHVTEQLGEHAFT